MGKMILLFSHKITKEQRADAKKSWGVDEFVSLPSDLQSLWSSVPATLEDIKEYLEPIREFLTQNLAKDDIVLVQGDFGATYMMVSVVKSLGGTALYATTKRNVVERELDGKIVKTSVFEHVRFRKF